MKYLSFFFFATLFFHNLSAQDCTNGRYYESIFESITEELDILYGEVLDTSGNVIKQLYVDVFYPEFDDDTNRPMIILAHGGSFTTGNKSDMKEYCRNFAKLGYVTASIQYRLLEIGSVDFNLGLDIIFKREVVDATHDMRAAIRYFRKSVAEEGNPYGINPDIIIVGGASAGAILANHVTYLDKESKIPNDLLSYFNETGGIEGNSGNSGYDSRPQMTLSWCGAILDTTWIENGAQPFLGFHNLGDNVVPNIEGQPDLGILTVPVTLLGDSSIYNRTLNVGVNSQYKSYPGNSHCVFGEDMGQIATDFLFEQLCIYHLSLEEKKPEFSFSLYPNPTNSAFTIEIPQNQKSLYVEVLNPLGQVVFSQTVNNNQSKIEVGASFQKGLYIVKVSDNLGNKQIQKLVVR